MNFDFSFVPDYMPYYLEGVKYTLLISLITVLFGALFGSLLFFMKTSNFHIWKIKPLKIIAVVYIEIIRGTPMLLQILIMYAGSKMFFGKFGRPGKIIIFDLLLVLLCNFFCIKLTGAQGRQQTVYLTLR